MEEEECIICLEIIDKKLGDYRIELCDKCKYIIHITCWENYIKYRGNSYCVVCNKIINDGNMNQPTQYDEYVDNNIIVVNNNTNKKKNILCGIFFMCLGVSIFIIIKTY
jgi:hypothetical protein